jgi:hypothetical protein
MSTTHLRVTRNLLVYMGPAFLFSRGEGTQGRDWWTPAIQQRIRDVQALEGLTSEERRLVRGAVAGATNRVEKATAAAKKSASHASALSVPLTALTVAAGSVYLLPKVMPYDFLRSILVLLAALVATMLGTIVFLFSLPPAPKKTNARSISDSIGSILHVAGDWIPFLFVGWLYASIAVTAWEAARSPMRRSWVWEVAFAGAIIPLVAAVSIALTAVTVAVVEARRESHQIRYVVNDALVLILMDLAIEAQNTIRQWHDPQARRRLVQRIESAAQKIETSFSYTARSLHGLDAAQAIRELGRRVAAGLRRHEQHVALAAGPLQVTKVRDALCSGLLAAAQGDWTNLSGVEPGSAVGSFLRGLWPRLLRFLFFGTATAGLLWLSQDTNWRSAAIAAAIPLGLSAVLSLLSPGEDVTKRAQDVLDRTFSPLWRP